MRVSIVIWLVMSGLRSIVVNFASTALGIFLCISTPYPHPACFHFLGVKGLELGFSAFTWVIVNDFHHYLDERSLPQGWRTDRAIQGNENEIEISKWDEGGFSEISFDTMTNSDGSIISAIARTIYNINKRRLEVGALSEGEQNQLIARGAVISFLEQSFGIKFIGQIPDESDELTETFFHRHREDIEKLIAKIWNHMEAIRKRRKCIHKGCFHCFTNKRQRKKMERKLRRDRLQVHLIDINNVEAKPLSRQCIEANEAKNIRRDLRDQFLHESYENPRIFFDQSFRITPRQSTTQTQIPIICDPDDCIRSIEVQTDPLSVKRIKIIEEQERKLSGHI